MRLAKPHVDVGIFTNNAEPMLAFWRDVVGLRYDHALPMGRGMLQHRFDMNGSVLKLNVARDPIPQPGPCGYRDLLIVREGLSEPRELADPDGNHVTLVPPGFAGIAGIEVLLRVRDPEAFHRFYGEALQLERDDEGTYRCGDSQLTFVDDPSATETGPLTGTGYRYTTIQVWDVDAEHAGILARGGREGRPPITLGTTARISFVRDPDGNWIEISQRASLTGPLPLE